MDDPDALGRTLDIAIFECVCKQSKIVILHYYNSNSIPTTQFLFQFPLHPYITKDALTVLSTYSTSTWMSGCA
jgi:hypothetical protein